MCSGQWLVADDPVDHSAHVAMSERVNPGAQWWVCRSANAAMSALARSGVCFHTLTK
jgi:hypothetical protein